VSLPCLRVTDAGIVLSLFVQPRASRSKLIGLVEQELKIAVAAPPVDGAANKACCLFLAKYFGLSKGRVTLVAGQNSRHKRVLLADVDPLDVEAQLRKSLSDS